MIIRYISGPHTGKTADVLRSLARQLIDSGEAIQIDHNPELERLKAATAEEEKPEPPPTIVPIVIEQQGKRIRKRKN